MSGSGMTVIPPADLKAEKDQEKRSMLAHEILDSERTYVALLDAMEEMYYGPSKKVLPKADHSAVFSNILTIRDLNKQFLIELDTRVSKWNEQSCLGDLFVSFAPHFKMYTFYVNNHERIGDLLSSMKRDKKYKAFQKFEKQQRKKPQTQGMRLDSFLIMPVQRIPRYKLLLEKIIKCTKQSHPDYKSVSNALQQVASVASHINNAVRASENRKVIADIQAKFENEQFVAPQRMFLVAGTLNLRVAAHTEEPRKFFLFNDMLVYSKHRRRGGKYKVIDKFMIDDRFDVEILTEPEEKKSIKIIYDQKSIICSASSTRDRNIWYAALKKCIQKREKTIDGRMRMRRRQSFILAPVVEDKKGASKCAVCERGFSLFRKKHTCKSCGRVVCDGCSKARLKVVAEDKLVRVCIVCVEKISVDMQAKADAEAAASGAVASTASGGSQRSGGSTAATTANDDGDRDESNEDEDDDEYYNEENDDEEDDDGDEDDDEDDEDDDVFEDSDDDLDDSFDEKQAEMMLRRGDSVSEVEEYSIQNLSVLVSQSEAGSNRSFGSGNAGGAAEPDSDADDDDPPSPPPPPPATDDADAPPPASKRRSQQRRGSRGSKSLRGTASSSAKGRSRNGSGASASSSSRTLSGASSRRSGKSSSSSSRAAGVRSPRSLKNRKKKSIKRAGKKPSSRDNDDLTTY
eukprot:TRINITY_DN66979_c8_g21_i1.p1 TRINITY_DN66979_c8_g21~~TRINITY_DN66979_c8_g21_i1.p1  ORF type:complete len:686 (+),score=380.58 TRINITY_DN66979_c8_g21_i1:66-2123(+)